MSKKSCAASAAGTPRWRYASTSASSNPSGSGRPATCSKAERNCCRYSSRATSSQGVMRWSLLLVFVVPIRRRAREASLPLVASLSVVSVAVDGQPASGVQQTVQRLGAAWQGIEMTLEALREGVEEAPGGLAIAELRMLRLTPFAQDVGDGGHRQHAGIHRLDEQVVSSAVTQLAFLVGGEA